MTEWMSKNHTIHVHHSTTITAAATSIMSLFAVIAILHNGCDGDCDYAAAVHARRVHGRETKRN